MPSTTYIALIRGINVGGNKKIKMADLRMVFEDAGCEDVTSYIQSGNVVFRSDKKAPALTSDLERGIEASAGFHAHVILRTRAELRNVMDANPWKDQDIEGTQLVAWFFKSKPPKDAFAAIDADAFAPEEFVVHGNEVYLHLPDGQGRSKLVEAMGKLKIEQPLTARNWKSVTKLLELADETASRR